jgi:hypothetical protein
MAEGEVIYDTQAMDDCIHTEFYTTWDLANILVLPNNYIRRS